MVLADEELAFKSPRASAAPLLPRHTRSSMLVKTPRAACGLALASLLFVVAPVSAQSAAEGTLDAGPTGQGDCTASGVSSISTFSRNHAC